MRRTERPRREGGTADDVLEAAIQESVGLESKAAHTSYYTTPHHTTLAHLIWIATANRMSMAPSALSLSRRPTTPRAAL